MWDFTEKGLTRSRVLILERDLRNAWVNERVTCNLWTAYYSDILVQLFKHNHIYRNQDRFRTFTLQIQNRWVWTLSHGDIQTIGIGISYLPLAGFKKTISQYLQSEPLYSWRKLCYFSHNSIIQILRQKEILNVKSNWKFNSDIVAVNMMWRQYVLRLFGT